MAEASAPCLFERPASKGAGAAAVPGHLVITATKVKWLPGDATAAAPAVIELAAITSAPLRAASSLQQ